jgi:hypothetical protein
MANPPFDWVAVPDDAASRNLGISVNTLRTDFQQYAPAVALYIGHRGGPDTVEVFAVDDRPRLLGAVHVPDLLDLGTHEVARAAIGTAMDASMNLSIWDKYNSGDPWQLLLRLASTGRFCSLPVDLMWPTHPNTRERIEEGDEGVVVVFGDAAVALVKAKRPLPADPVPDDESYESCGGASGGPAAHRPPAPSGQGGTKRLCGDTLAASGAPATGLRAVLFTSASAGSLMQVEANMLYQRGLVLTVVYPDSVEDIAACIDAFKPRIVVVSATHNGAAESMNATRY